MKNLKVCFECIDGYYNLNIFDDHTYSVDTNIEYLETRSGIVDNFNEFEKKLNEVNILSWDSNYDSNIENPVRWNVTLDDYSSSGLEGNRLTIVTMNEFSASCANKDDSKKLINDVIDQEIGAHVEIEIIGQKDGERFRDVFSDLRALSETLNFDIEEED